MWHRSTEWASAAGKVGWWACSAQGCRTFNLWKMSYLWSAVKQKSVKCGTPVLHSFLKLSILLKKFFLFISFRDREEPGVGGICCSTYLCIHWLVLICPLTRDGTHNLGVWVCHSNHLSHPPGQRWILFCYEDSNICTSSLTLAVICLFYFCF